jgi:DNA polymerase-3 subunit epsilon
MTKGGPGLLFFFTHSINKKMQYKLFTFDLETTGVIPSKNHIWQLAYRMYVNKELVEEKNLKFAPVSLDDHNPKAIEMSGLELEEMAALPMSAAQAFAELKADLDHHVDPYNKNDKFIIAGYNVHFDEAFLRAFFNHMGNKWYGAYFWSGRICALTLAQVILKESRHLMPNFQLSTVAARLGFDVDESKAHDGLYDLTMTEHILRKTSVLPKL